MCALRSLCAIFLLHKATSNGNFETSVTKTLEVIKAASLPASVHNLCNCEKNTKCIIEAFFRFDFAINLPTGNENKI